MHCPFCRSTDTRVLDSRVADDGSSIRRRRICSACEKRFTTVEQMQLTVIKRSGTSEPFTRVSAHGPHCGPTGSVSNAGRDTPPELTNSRGLPRSDLRRCGHTSGTPDWSPVRVASPGAQAYGNHYI